MVLSCAVITQNVQLSTARTATRQLDLIIRMCHCKSAAVAQQDRGQHAQHVLHCQHNSHTTDGILTDL